MYTLNALSVTLDKSIFPMHKCEYKKKESASRVTPVSYCEQFVSRHFSPVKADDTNKKMKLWANVQRRPNGGSSECVCVFVLGRDDYLLEPAGYKLCLPNRPAAAGLR